MGHKTHGLLRTLLQSALLAHEASDFAKARALYDQALAIDPDNFFAKKNLGALQIQQGEIAQAIALLEPLAKKSDDSDVINNLFHCFCRQGDFTKALELGSTCANRNPRSAFAWNMVGMAYLHQNKINDALAPFEQAYDLEPQNPEILYNLALSHQRSRRYEKAADLYKKALDLWPNVPEILNNFANCELKANRLSHALELCQKALKIRPDFYQGRITLARVLHSSNQTVAAMDAIECAIRGSSAPVEALIIKSEILAHDGLFEMALECDEKAITLASENALAWNSKGATLSAMGRSLDAVGPLQRAIDLNPKFVEAWVSLGNCYCDLANFSLAEECYKSALVIEPESSLARYHRGLLKLRLGDFQEGWTLFKNRWETNAPEFISRFGALPEYSRTQSSGTRVLFWAEQGVGENILFASLLSEIEAQPIEAVVSIDQRLIGMLSRRFPGIRFIPRDPPEGFCQSLDAHMALGDLGGLFRPNADSFSRQVIPYLSPSNDHLEAVLSRCDRRKLRVGITWESKNPRFKSEKSIPIHNWLPLLDLEGVDFVNLQYDVEAPDMDLLSRRVNFVTDPNIDLKMDLEGVLALACTCDLIISVSTAFAHLVGAAGLPGFLLLPHSQGRFWFWGVEQSKSLWYPSLTLVNQETPGDWSYPLAQVQAEIARLLATNQASSNTL